ncbi:MAG: sigma 54-interacting transcriptional regulator [Acidobacteria bacterium]|nr:sigma 54-interacting transcriptional regulator [Acidobacteriota bacterium]
MKKVLVCWIGNTDLRAPTEKEKVGLGPIAQASAHTEYDEIDLLTDYSEDVTEDYLAWLRSRTRAITCVYREKLSGPTQFGEIYQAVVRSVLDIQKRNGNAADLTFHLSPGTPAMAAVWVILAKTRFPATLIESSLQYGVRIASVPFDISAEFIPDLLAKPDRELARYSMAGPPEAPEFSDIICRSDVMVRLLEKARRVAPRSVPVLIEGESGTGKELLARAIHRSSTRKDEPFVAVNCGAISAELVESELFGHAKGAYTGAEKSRAGYFEAAGKGTLFLDEIGELPLSAQVKLLRALQEREIVRVGSTKTIKTDARIIAATNRNLIQEAVSGRFRSDLFYRLAVAILQIPPLRERSGDLGFLVDSLLEQVNRESATEPGYTHKKISVAARNILLSHPWPGNVRELLNTLRRAAIWASDETIGPDDIRGALLPVSFEGGSDILDKPLGNGLDLQQIIADVARLYLIRALKEAQGNKTKAASLLGLPSYQTLTNWLKRYEVDS